MSKPSKAINPRTKKLNLANQQLRPRGGHRRYEERKNSPHHANIARAPACRMALSAVSAEAKVIG
jgi:hypothetical protein